MPKGDPSLAAALRAARVGRGLSVRELARRLDRSPSVISQIETGRAAPSSAMLRAIVDELGIDPDELYSIARPDHPPANATRGGRPPVAESKAVRADARRNRAKLLKAASELFAQEGLEVSVAEIAEHADVTVATLFRHFPTKRHLIQAIGEQRVTAIDKMVQEALVSTDLREALTSVFEKTMAMQARDRGLVELIERVLSPDLHAELVRNWAALLSRAQEAGIVRRDITAEDIPFLLAGSGGVGRLLSGARPNLTRRYARLLFDSLRPDPVTPLASTPPSIREVVDAFQSAQADVR